jgi:hypothetical protein
MEAVHSSETMVNIYHTAWHKIPEGSALIVTTMGTSNLTRAQMFSVCHHAIEYFKIHDFH